MKTRFLLLFLFVFTSVINSFSQDRNSIWCFGDSAGIDFSNAANPVPITTGLRTRGSCASISDTSGQLLFYANDRTNTAGDYTTLVYNKQNQIMPNGDSIVGEDWYNEMVIIPWPENDSLYYLFVISLLGPQGLYYSIINMNADSGRGDVIAKNIQLQTTHMVDCLNAIKHANGRDWWLFFRKITNFTTGNNNFHSYLISPAGITNHVVQSVGSFNKTDLGQFKFNRDGTKICFNNYRGLLELYDFDRCSGIISNPQTIYSDNGFPPWPARWSNEFSLSGDYLYVCNNPDDTYLVQYNLNAANIAASEVTLWTTSFPPNCGGALKRAPNSEKIYFSCVYSNGFFPYPYPDSVYNTFNMNLGVINFPDSLGAACDFQPYSFYLGGKRTYWGLPNNPDYELGAVTGSICDSLTAIKNNQAIKENIVSVFPNPVTDKLTITTTNNSLSEIILYDIASRKLLHQKFKNTVTLNTTRLAKGMYIYEVINNKGVIGKGKVVKE